MEEKKEFYIPHLLLGLSIVFSVLVLMGMATHHITDDLLLSICFPVVLFLIFVRAPKTEH